MSSAEERDAEVLITNTTSPTSSTSISDSESMSDDKEEPSELFNELEEDENEEGRLHSDIIVQNSVLFMRELPRNSGGSISPPEINEAISSEMDYPLSQRVYSNSPCPISAVLQMQSRELWNQFDSIGTEMIVTRRGRLDI